MYWCLGNGGESMRLKAYTDGSYSTRKKDGEEVTE